MLILPVVCFVLIALWRCDKKEDARTALLSAVLICGVLVVASSEVLGHFNLLAAHALALFWGSLGLILALLLRRRLRLRIRRPLMGPLDVSMLVILGIIFSVLGTIALFAPPNTWDSMTYHLGRVMHWIQNRNLDHYPTNILRQLYYQPGAELFVLQSMLLSGSDRFANLVQLFALAGSALGVSVITRDTGGSSKSQWFAALFVMTIPMAMLQATGTQNDLVVALWLVCFLLFGIRFRREPTWLNALLAGSALGLALLTKATAWLFAPPLFLALLFVGERVQLPAGKILSFRFIGKIAAVIVVAAAIIAPFSLRNKELFGSPLGPPQSAAGDFKVTHDRLTPTIFGATIVRNVGMHLGTPSKRVNARIENAIRKVLGSETENPASTWIGSRFRVRPSLHEDVAGNPLHTLLIAAALLLIAVSWKRQRIGVFVYGAAILIAFMLFCGYLKWQPFHSRLHLPLFILAAPLVSVALVRRINGKILAGIMVVLLAGTLPWLLLNESRPIIDAGGVLSTPRHTQYFANRPDLESTFSRLAELVRRAGVSSVGIAWSEDDWEYPLWVLLGKSDENPRIGHVLVGNPSAAAADRSFVPDLVLATRPLPEGATIGSTRFITIQRIDKVGVLVPISRLSPDEPGSWTGGLPRSW